MRSAPRPHPRRSTVAHSLRRLAAAALLSAVAPASVAATLDLRRLCDQASVLTVVGLDTVRGDVLLALPNEQTDVVAAQTWLAELVPSATEVAFVAEDGRHLGGSFGPGPVVSGVACGEGCLGLERFRGAAHPNGPWEPLPGTLAMTPSQSFVATYDGGGALWAVLLESGARPGETLARAYRRHAGVWEPRGTIGALAVGSPAAYPAPGAVDAILVGTARFAAGEAPRPWVASLPTVADARRGQLVAVDPTAAAYLAADGVVFTTEDGGTTWRQQIWTPWRVGVVQVWQRGTDYTVDLPAGQRGPFALPVLFFDQRERAEPRLLVAGWRPGREAAAAWTVELDVVARVASGELRLDTTEVIQRRDGDWLLLSGCVTTPSGAALVVRTVVGGGVSAPQELLLRPVVGTLNPTPQTSADPR